MTRPSDTEVRKRFMKKGLAVALTVAWGPIIWMLVSVLLSPLLLQVSHSAVLAQVIIVPVTAAVLLLFLRVFRFMGEKFYG